MSRFEQCITEHYRIILVILLLINVSLGIASSLGTSLTYDEPTYIGAGQYMLETGDTTAVVAASPPLPYLVNGLFWYFLKFDASVWRNFPKFYKTGYQSLPLIFESGHNPDLLVFLARMPIILTFPLLGLVVFAWARELFGVKAGLFALVLTAFCPNLIAHEQLATTDFLAVLTIVGTLYCFRHYLNNPLRSWLLASGITLGLALLTRFTAIILFPTYIILSIGLPHNAARRVTHPVHYIRTSILLARRPGHPKIIYGLAVTLLIAFVLIWAGYLFEFRCLYVPHFETVPAERYLKGILQFLYEKGIKIPAASYFVSFYHQVLHGQTGHPNFFMGKTSWSGKWYYFPVAFLIKTPIPTLVFVGICLVALLKPTNRKKGEEAFLIIPIAVYMAASVFTNINIGLRHILPIFPLLYVWISRVVTFKPSKWYPASVVLLLVWYIGENLYIYPHYLEYFNEIIGGPKNGYKYLVDSNLDWGQDLKLLVRYLKKNNIQPERIAYFGAPHLLEYYGYQDTTRNCSELDRGYIAISATFLYGLYLDPNCYDWLKKYEPMDRIGYSIFIYKIPP